MICAIRTTAEYRNGIINQLIIPATESNVSDAVAIRRQKSRRTHDDHDRTLLLGLVLCQAIY
uniref:Uncharacterized protein n=1 Tax=Rhizophora mucronata TaxID=61149 RepID=A0A2P2KBI6_RHIMU